MQSGPEGMNLLVYTPEKNQLCLTIENTLMATRGERAGDRDPGVHLS